MNTQALNLLKAVKDRLGKFYDDAAASSAASFVQLSSDDGSSEGEDNSEDVSPADRPKSFRRYRKKARSHGGVMGLMGALIADLTKEITEAKAEEELAQQAYESMLKDA